MRFKSFEKLCEVKGEKAHREAIAMGLKYKGFGYWADPQTGETKYKTVNDQLVEVEPDVESEKAGKGMDAAGEASTASLQDKGTPLRDAQPGATQNPSGPDTRGKNIGSAEPGLEQAPERASWEPGPDGDHCVDSANPPGDIPLDSFVGKTNYYQWSAGPDGTNFTNVKLKGLNTPQQDVGIHEATEEDSALKPAGKYTQPSLGGELSYGTSARKMVKRMIQPGRTGEAKGRTTRDAKSAMNKMRPELRQKQVQALLDIKNREIPNSRVGASTAERDKRHDVWRKKVRMPAIQKDAEATDDLNLGISHLVSDPNFDLDQFDDNDFEEGGAFGDVHVGDDYVVKRGAIGPDEMKALYAMRDNPGFPTLINGRLDGPFKHQSSLYNNPNNADNERRAPGQEDYWDPDEQSDFDKKFPTAPGTYAMTRAKGRPLFNQLDYMDEDQQEEMVTKFWKLRAALHEAGFSHNDMHGGNIFVDDDGNPSIIDLGLAKDDPVSALMEALGGADYEQGNDYQLSHGVGGASIPLRMQEMFDTNRETVREMIMDTISLDGDDYDDYDADSDYSPTMSGITQTLEDMMGGDIRMSREDLDNLRTQLPILGDRKKVLGLIRALYKGVDGRQSDLEKRMSDAFDKRQQDSRLIDIVNKMRKEKGRGSIEIKNKNVIPPKNIDFDD